MTRSLVIRKRQAAKGIIPAPEQLKPKEFNLLAIPYSSTTISEPPVQLVSVKTLNSPLDLCSGIPSPVQPISCSSSIYPSSTHSTIVPGSSHSSTLSPFPVLEQSTPSALPKQRTNSIRIVKEVWEDMYGVSGSTYEVEPENELPAYLGPHIINSERDEDQPAELFAVPLLRSREATNDASKQASSSRRLSRFIETEAVVMTSKKKLGFWASLRLGRKRHNAPSWEQPPPPLLLEKTRSSRIGSRTNTITTTISAVGSDPGPRELMQSAPNTETAWNPRESHKKQPGHKFQDKAAVTDSSCSLSKCESGQELYSTIPVDIPRESRFGEEFWACFTRRFI